MNHSRPHNKEGDLHLLGNDWILQESPPKLFNHIGSTDLTKKAYPNKVTWSIECEQAFKNLKKALTSAALLRSPDFSLPFILQTHTSDKGVGAVLSQGDEEGQDHPVAYWSWKLLPRERHYSTKEKECLPIKLAVQAFQLSLLGQPFTIMTDHHALVWMDTSNTRLARWNLTLQPFEFTVVYRPGKVNANGDAMSHSF